MLLLFSGQSVILSHSNQTRQPGVGIRGNESDRDTCAESVGISRLGVAAEARLFRDQARFVAKFPRAAPARVGHASAARILTAFQKLHDRVREVRRGGWSLPMPAVRCPTGEAPAFPALTGVRRPRAADARPRPWVRCAQKGERRPQSADLATLDESPRPFHPLRTISGRPPGGMTGRGSTDRRRHAAFCSRRDEEPASRTGWTLEEGVRGIMETPPAFRPWPGQSSYSPSRRVKTWQLP